MEREASSTLTLSQAISQALAADIMSGRITAGARLDELSIADRFKVSRSPVRDALRQLALTKLVEHQPRRGFTVSGIDEADLKDLYEGLMEIEAVCAEMCALRASSVERARLQILLTSCKAASERGDHQAYVAANDEFHLAIYAASHNETLRQVAHDLRQRLSPLRTKPFFLRDRIDHSLAEHQTLLDAIFRKDGPAAARAMRDHAAQTALNVMERAFPIEQVDLSSAA